MDTDTLVMNVVTLLISLIAVGVTAIFSVRQVRLMTHANKLPVVLDLFKEWRDPEFVRREQRLWERLPPEPSAERGFSGLEEPLRSDAYEVCTYYQMLAYLVAFDVIEEDLIFLAVHYRLLKTWEVVEPYVLAERRARGDFYSFMNFFEELALMTSQKSTADVYRSVRGRVFGRGRPRLPARRLSGR
ncbi:MULTISPECIES: DUF4760 domain-containing protein [Streptomyces violaceusniger group]|uniref:DUF4760 domain-containing protein n=2 Tax=Streptomyces rhizosphaericus TaxID=114699 RepID=A0ABN1S7M4_9ACTN|nr:MULTISPECIES: hypothetical protein [Streptomyces violaceusniger group]